MNVEKESIDDLIEWARDAKENVATTWEIFNVSSMHSGLRSTRVLSEEEVKERRISELKEELRSLGEKV